MGRSQDHLVKREGRASDGTPPDQEGKKVARKTRGKGDTPTAVEKEVTSERKRRIVRTGQMEGGRNVILTQRVSTEPRNPAAQRKLDPIEIEVDANEIVRRPGSLTDVPLEVQRVSEEPLNADGKRAEDYPGETVVEEPGDAPVLSEQVAIDTAPLDVEKATREEVDRREAEAPTSVDGMGKVHGQHAYDAGVAEAAKAGMHDADEEKVEETEANRKAREKAEADEKAKAKAKK
jgi:hypothetical protein